MKRIKYMAREIRSCETEIYDTNALGIVTVR